VAVIKELSLNTWQIDLQYVILYVDAFIRLCRGESPKFQSRRFL
jgi:hypothetical protein